MDEERGRYVGTYGEREQVGITSFPPQTWIVECWRVFKGSETTSQNKIVVIQHNYYFYFITKNRTQDTQENTINTSAQLYRKLL